jgi:hypothetical protein
MLNLQLDRRRMCARAVYYIRGCNRIDAFTTQFEKCIVGRQRLVLEFLGLYDFFRDS